MPTVPLDPPTSWGIAALMVLAGSRLVRAGRGDVAFKGAVAFSVVFAVSVQWFLFRWPDWMYAYLIPATELPPAVVSPFFFVAVVGSGAAGAFISWTLIRQGRMAWAVANVAFGLGGWLVIQAATWDRYFHVGTFAEYHSGQAPRLSDAGSFYLEMNLAGLIQVGVGVGITALLVKAGRRLAPGSTQPPVVKR